ncbi:MAG: hypothetical protein ACE5NJ_06620 [Thermodesulfobacteriota bacterium]
MKLSVIISMLAFLVTPISTNVAVGASKAGTPEQITGNEMADRWKEITVHRDPFLGPEWLKKQKEEEERKKAEETRRREEEKKRQALKLRGIVQVGNQFVAIIDGKTLREGDVIRGRKILEVNRSGIKVLCSGKVRKIPWRPKR